MSKWDADNLNAAHSQRHLDEIPQRTAPTVEQMEASVLARAIAAAPAHPDDEAIDRFSAAMKAKMKQSRDKGRGGWEGETCSAQHLSDLLRGHLEKPDGGMAGGDPVDVGNFCMMLFNRGERVQPAAAAVKEAAAVMRAAWDADFAHRDLVLAACFAAQAYETAVASGVTADGAPAALLRALLTALIDPLSADLDYLRADPAAGVAARSALEGGAA